MVSIGLTQGQGDLGMVIWGHQMLMTSFWLPQEVIYLSPHSQEMSWAALDLKLGDSPGHPVEAGLWPILGSNWLWLHLLLCSLLAAELHSQGGEHLPDLWKHERKEEIKGLTSELLLRAKYSTDLSHWRREKTHSCWRERAPRRGSADPTAETCPQKEDKRFSEELRTTSCRSQSTSFVFVFILFCFFNFCLFEVCLSKTNQLQVK